jgi:hypothetical protein
MPQHIDLCVGYFRKADKEVLDLSVTGKFKSMLFCGGRSSSRWYGGRSGSQIRKNKKQKLFRFLKRPDISMKLNKIGPK